MASSSASTSKYARLDKRAALQLLAHKVYQLDSLEKEMNALQAHLDGLDAASAGGCGAGDATVAAHAHRHAGHHEDAVDPEALKAGPKGSKAYMRAHREAFATRTRYLIRLENCFHRFGHPFHAEEWEDKAFDVLDTILEEAELLGELADLEAERKAKFGSETEPLYDDLPALGSPLEDIVHLHTKASQLMAMWRLTSHPKIVRLHPQAVKASMATSDEEVAAMTHKAQLLKDVHTHLKDLQLLGREMEYDLSTPLEAVKELWQETHADHQLLRRFSKCQMCGRRHAPRKVLKRHPHLNLLPTGTTHRGSHNCCANCAMYWD